MLQLRCLPLLASIVGCASGIPVETGPVTPPTPSPNPLQDSHTTDIAASSSGVSDVPSPTSSTRVQYVSFCNFMPCANGFDCINGVCQPRGQPQICGGFIGVPCPEGHSCLTPEGIADAFGSCMPIPDSVIPKRCGPGNRLCATGMVCIASIWDSLSGVCVPEVSSLSTPPPSASQPAATESTAPFTPVSIGLASMSTASSTPASAEAPATVVTFPAPSPSAANLMKRQENQKSSKEQRSSPVAASTPSSDVEGSFSSTTEASSSFPAELASEASESARSASDAILFANVEPTPEATKAPNTASLEILSAAPTEVTSEASEAKSSSSSSSNALKSASPASSTAATEASEAASGGLVATSSAGSEASSSLLTNEPRSTDDFGSAGLSIAAEATSSHGLSSVVTGAGLSSAEVTSSTTSSVAEPSSNPGTFSAESSSSSVTPDTGHSSSETSTRLSSSSALDFTSTITTPSATAAVTASDAAQFPGPDIPAAPTITIPIGGTIDLNSFNTIVITL